MSDTVNAGRKTPRSVTLNGITKVFRDPQSGQDVRAVESVSFRLEPGELVTLLGPSGCGKTTVLRILSGFEQPTSGRILIGEMDVTDAPANGRDTAMVFQSYGLFPHMSVFDNVAIARPGATRAQVEEALEAAQCADIVAKLPQGLETQVGSEGVHLSGGEQQRIALARAILKDSPIVVLDEATAFADPENEALIQKAIERLAEGRTVIMVAHRLSSVAHADGIVVLDRGRAVESGTHDELVRAGGLYARMWKDFCTAIDWKVGKEVS